MSRKTSFLVISKIFDLFVNPLTVDDLNWLQVLQPIQMQLPKKQKIFSLLSSQFLKLGQILHVSQKKMSLIAYVFPKLETAKDVVSEMSKKQRFRAPFDSQHPKGCETLVKSA